MTDGIKGTRPLPSLTPSQIDKTRRDTSSEESEASYVEAEKSARSIEEARQAVEAATEEVRKIEARSLSFAPTENRPAESPRSERSFAPPPDVASDDREVASVEEDPSITEEAPEVAEPPIRDPQEATRIAERVSRDIVANPSQALSVNINVAAVRALFS